MTQKLYAHFVADFGSRGRGEFRGIVELGAATPFEQPEEALARELARDLEIPPRDIRVLRWARLH